MEKHEFWYLQPGEIPGDPLSLSRDIARMRIESMIYERGRKGQMAGGIPVSIDGNTTIVRIMKDDYGSMRDLIDLVWKADCAKYERLQAARTQGETTNATGSEQNTGRSD